jgi:lipoyl-dependent peroxiredoxin
MMGPDRSTNDRRKERPMISRRADARWEGDLKQGQGNLKLGSGAFDGPYSFGSRFESAPGTNPEELLGAAHAGCFTMWLANALAGAGHVPTRVETTATVHLDKVGEGFSVTGIDLRTVGRVPGLSADEFRRWAEKGKTDCIISRALSVPMTLEAVLDNSE